MLWFQHIPIGSSTSLRFTSSKCFLPKNPLSGCKRLVVRHFVLEFSAFYCDKRTGSYRDLYGVLWTRGGGRTPCHVFVQEGGGEEGGKGSDWNIQNQKLGRASARVCQHDYVKQMDVDNMFFLPNAQLRTHSLSYLQFVVNSEIKLKVHRRQKREIKNYQHLHEQVTSDSCDSEDHVCTSFSRECLASAVTTATRWCPLSRLITDQDCQPWLATFSFSSILTSFLSLSF